MSGGKKLKKNNNKANGGLKTGYFLNGGFRKTTPGNTCRFHVAKAT